MIKQSVQKKIMYLSEFSYLCCMQMTINRYLRCVDAKESTRATYKKVLDSFVQWVERTDRAFLELTQADIIAYKDFLLKENKSSMTINLYLSTIRGFYKWLTTEGICENIAQNVGSVRTNKSTFRRMHLENEQGAELLTEVYIPKRVYGVNHGVTKKLQTNEKLISLRNYAMINLMLRTGLRTIEVSRADIGDVTTKRERRVLKVWGKGHSEKDDFVILTDESWNPIEQYLQERGVCKPQEPLFATNGLGHQGTRLSTRSIQNICKKSLRAIGLDGHEYSAHSLRHTTGTQILKNGGTMMDVQQVLRHSSPSTSQIYVNTIMEDKRIDDASEQILDGSFKVDKSI